MPRRLTDELQLQKVGIGLWGVLRRYAWEMDDGFVAEALEGDTTDLSSVPKLARLFVPKDRTEGAGVIHDQLYKTGVVPRSTADRYWREIAVAGDGARSTQAWVGWAGLKVGGWWAWRKYRKGTM